MVSTVLCQTIESVVLTNSSSLVYYACAFLKNFSVTFVVVIFNLLADIIGDIKCKAD